jgi:hypothetical protein
MVISSLKWYLWAFESHAGPPSECFFLVPCDPHPFACSLSGGRYSSAVTRLVGMLDEKANGLRPVGLRNPAN